MAFVQVTRIPRPGALARVADAGLLFTGLAVPFVMIAAGALIALPLAGVVWLVQRLFD